VNIEIIKKETNHAIYLQGHFRSRVKVSFIFYAVCFVKHMLLLFNYRYTKRIRKKNSTKKEKKKRM